MRNKKEKRIMLFLLVIFAITVGYALLSQQLNINGTAKIDKTTWKIIWNNVQVSDGSVTGDQVVQEPTIDTNKTTVEYSINLKQPKEFYEFTVDAVNEGTIDGMIDVISNKIYESDGVTEKELPSYLTYTVTYGDNYEIDEKHLLKANTTETYKVRVEFKDIDNPEELPQSDVMLKFKFSVDYIQADENGVERDRYSPFISDFSTQGLSVMSFDIDHDKCVEISKNQMGEENAEAYCNGEDVDVNGTTHNIKQDTVDIYDAPEYYEELGLIKNLKYGKMESYEINYEGCKNYLINNGETDEEQIELACTGNTATILGHEGNLYDDLKAEASPEEIGIYEYMGIINVTYSEAEPYEIITSYDGEIPKDLVIPAKIHGKPVGRIAEGAFENKGIESVTLPDTIMFVEENAFDNNNLISVNIGKNNPDIRECAFGDKDNIVNHNLPETYKCKKIYWALQDNNNDNTNEALILSDVEVLGNKYGKFNEDKIFDSYEEIPWIGNYFDGPDNDSYNVTNVEIEGTISPKSTNYWFSNVGYNVQSLSMDLENLDTSRVTNMHSMFNKTGYKATTIELAGLNNWDTSKVTDMSYMFYATGESATSFNLNLSGWNTSQVTDMYSMFAGIYTTTFKITIPQTNSNGISNDTTHMYGSKTSTFAEPPSDRVFTLASN